MRVAYLVSAAMPGVLPRVPLLCNDGKLELSLSMQDAPLASDRLFKRLSQLARIVGRTPHFMIG
jgi:exopolyphosphatase/guanosine-5'-triphosphate,3'-diphosphate pyrophosphatase